MRRARAALRTLIAILVVTAPGCTPDAQEPAETDAAAAKAKRPHVIIYMVDTLRADHLGVYGYERSTTPKLDAFAREAVVFDRTWSTSSWTRPAIASLLTGLAPSGHGATTRATGLDPSAVLLAERLHALGHHTAAFVTNPNVLPVWGFDRGFDAFYDIESVARSARADRVNEVVFEHLAGLKDEEGGQPLFLYIHTRDPHDPYDPPPPFDTRFDGDPLVAAYDGEIAFNDDQFGRLLDFLKQRGIYDESIIVFVSDHGEELNERGKLGHGHSLHEELVRVPLVVKLPGGELGGSRIASPATLVDLVPTLLARLGVPAPDALEGIDLLAEDAAPRQRPIFAELDLLAAKRQNVMAGVRLGDHKLVEVSEPEPATLLFDLAADPGELNDLSASDAATRAALQRVLDDWRAKSSGGLHLWLMNDGDAARGRARVAEGTIVTDGRLRLLRKSEIEEGDVVELDESGRRLHFRLTLVNRRNPIKGPPKRLVDRDGLVLDVEPPNAELRIERLSFDGAPGDIYLGLSGSPSGAAPLAVAADDPRLRVQSMAALLRGSRARSSDAPQGAHLALVPRVRGEAVEISPDLEERLRALGYME